MIYSKQRLKEVTALKRQAVRLIQHDIGQIHVSPSRKYIKEFTREFQTFENVCNARDIVEAARGANLIWIGDYHALGQTQAYAAKFIRQLAGNKNNLIVAVEPVFARDQEILDRWMNGIISE